MPDDTKQVVSSSRPTFLHPYSGLAILGLDWLLFSSGFITLGASTVVMPVVGFVAGTVVVTVCQRFARRDSWLVSLAKGIPAGIVVGIPFPIAGTVVGGTILAISGLSSLKRRGEEK